MFLCSSSFNSRILFSISFRFSLESPGLSMRSCSFIVSESAFGNSRTSSSGPEGLGLFCSHSHFHWFGVWLLGGVVFCGGGEFGDEGRCWGILDGGGGLGSSCPFSSKVGGGGGGRSSIPSSRSSCFNLSSFLRTKAIFSLVFLLSGVYNSLVFFHFIMDR